MIPKPSMNSRNRCPRRSSASFLAASRSFVTSSRSAARFKNSASRRAYSCITARSRFDFARRSEGNVSIGREDRKWVLRYANLRASISWPSKLLCRSLLLHLGSTGEAAYRALGRVQHVPRHLHHLRHRCGTKSDQVREHQKKLNLHVLKIVKL